MLSIALIGLIVAFSLLTWFLKAQQRRERRDQK